MCNVLHMEPKTKAVVRRNLLIMLTLHATRGFWNLEPGVLEEL